MAGDVFDEFTGSVRLATAKSDIGLGNNAHQPAVLIDDGDTPHLLVLHGVYRLLHVIFRMTCQGIPRHNIASQDAVGVTAFGNDVEGQIAIGYDANQFPAVPSFADRYRTDIFGLHQLSDPAHGICGHAAGGIRSRHLHALHGFAP
jgi:hypothetical protein